MNGIEKWITQLKHTPSCGDHHAKNNGNDKMWDQTAGTVQELFGAGSVEKRLRPGSPIPTHDRLSLFLFLSLFLSLLKTKHFLQGFHLLFGFVFIRDSSGKCQVNQFNVGFIVLVLH